MLTSSAPDSEGFTDFLYSTSKYNLHATPNIIDHVTSCDQQYCVINEDIYNTGIMFSLKFS